MTISAMRSIDVDEGGGSGQQMGSAQMGSSIPQVATSSGMAMGGGGQQGMMATGALGLPLEQQDQWMQTSVVPVDFQTSINNQQYHRKGSAGSQRSHLSDLSVSDDPAASPPHQQTTPKMKKSALKKPSSSSAGAAPIAPPTVVVPQIPLPDTPDPELLKLDPTDVMHKLQASMDRTTNTQKLLQDWDRSQGLPKSHSQTMVNSSRSRKQLTDGVILKKWNGAPLLNFEEGGQQQEQEEEESLMGGGDELGEMAFINS